MYAEAYFDCDGNCLNDADGDLVCDELEVDGCTDETACNYSEEATEEDDSCTYAEAYFDCDGNCLNDADGDLVCDELEVDGARTRRPATTARRLQKKMTHARTRRPTSTVTAIV